MEEWELEQWAVGIPGVEDCCILQEDMTKPDEETEKLLERYVTSSMPKYPLTVSKGNLLALHPGKDL